MFVYIELHCHSAFSFLDGTSLPAELVAAALELGYEGMALTDHNAVAGSMEYAVAVNALAHEQGIRFKAIHGAEVDLDDGRHLTLLVKDRIGWGNLCRLLTRAHAGTREGPGNPEETGGARSSIALRPQVSLEDVTELSAGLFCLSGCAARGVHDEPSLRRLRDAFGTNRLKVELQRPYLYGDTGRNRELAKLADRLQLRTVATGNVHAHTIARARLQDAFVALRTHQTLDSSEPDRRGNFSHVLASPQAMAARFSGHLEAVIETERIAEQLEFDLRADLGYRYPGEEDPHKLQELTELCTERLHRLYDPEWRRGLLGTPGAGGTAQLSAREALAKAESRLTEELNLIRRHNLAAFFLVHHEMLELARDVAAEVRGGEFASLLTAAGVGGSHDAASDDQRARAALPPGRGRGSSVSSIVCYLTGLSHIDPIANELSIGRFLSEDLEALPDIDLDFPRDIRQVLIPRVHEHFGSDHAALVAAYPTYRARGAIRELGKVLGLPPSQIERVARGSEGWDAAGVGDDIKAAFPSNTSSGRWEWLAKLAAESRGLPRHLSQHPGGMIVSTRPLIECCPVAPAAMDGRYIAQWDKDSCGDAGFLKIDLLGLGMLSAVERCVELITETRGTYVDLSRIDHNDDETFTAIQAAETTGVFQIESRAQMQSLLRTQPRDLKELAIQVAIVRPGPIQGGAVSTYVERRQRTHADPAYPIPYEHPSLKRALEETLGAIIFQDQVLEVAIDFAGFRPGQAEQLRRAMSRKRSEEAIEFHHRDFVEGAMTKHDVSEELAERIWTKVKGFAGFGFPKAHAAAFGLLAYQSTYLRVHYAPEFLCSLLNEQPLGFYPPDALVHEAQRRGITIHPPDVNRSQVLCSVDPDGSVRIGLGYVRGARAEQTEALVAERERNGEFRSLTELASRAGAGAQMLELLAWAGACDALAEDATARLGDVGISPRRVALWELGAATQPCSLGAGGVQLTLPLDLPQAPQLREMSAWEQLLADYGSTGLTAGAHPMEVLRERLPPGSVNSRGLAARAHGERVTVAGMVMARQRPGTAGGVVFILLEDEAGTMNVIVPPRVYEQFRLAVRTEPLLSVEGKVEKLAAAGGAINVLADTVGGISLPGAELAAVTELIQIPEPPVPAEGGDEIDDFRAVAPPVMSFASGRRR